MPSQDNELDKTDRRLVQGYERLLQRADQILTSFNESSGDVLNQALDKAREKTVELGELSREEADRVHDFVARDLHAAGRYLAEDERELADWLRLNLLIIEKTLLQRFNTLSQAASLELDHLHRARQRFDEWHTGEVTTIGTLVCKSCGEQIHFEQTGHIPPCPKCHATVFERAKK
jgi:hypothetical protein